MATTAKKKAAAKAVPKLRWLPDEGGYSAAVEAGRVRIRDDGKRYVYQLGVVGRYGKWEYHASQPFDAGEDAVAAVEELYYAGQLAGRLAALRASVSAEPSAASASTAAAV